MQRRINSLAIRSYIEGQGEAGLAKLSIDSQISISTIWKLKEGKYPTTPRLAMRSRLCAAMSMTEDEVFPLVDAKSKSHAS